MHRRAFLASIALLGLIAPAGAQDYPARPIEFVVPWGPGGGADQVARKAAKLMEPMLKVSLPVINVAGATGVTGLNKMLTAEADGYTMSVMTGDTFGLLATTQPKWGLTDFVPLAIMIRQPSAFFVAEGGKYKTWADVEAGAKARAAQGRHHRLRQPRRDDHQFLQAQRAEARRGALPAAGRALFRHSRRPCRPPLRAARRRAQLPRRQADAPGLIFATERFKAFPDMPVSKELGHDIILPQFRMITVKAGTSPAQMKTLSTAIEVGAKDPEYAAYLEEQYADPNSYIGGSEAMKFLETELATMKALSK